MSVTWREGGIHSCCRDTLREHGHDAHEGQGLECQWCYGVLRFRAGSWEWVDPFDAFYEAIATDMRTQREARTREFFHLLDEKEKATHAR